MSAHRRQCGVDLVGRHDSDHLALVGDVQRVDAQEIARADHGRGDGKARLVEDDRQVGVPGELVADRANATPGRVAQPTRAGGGGEERLDEIVDRRGVRPDVRLEGKVATGQHHRHAVVGDRAGDEHPVARPHLFRSEHTSCWDQPDPCRRDVQPVGGARSDDLRVAGHDAHTGGRGGLSHVGDDGVQLGDREALLDHEGRGERHRPPALDGDVVHRSVHGQVPDRATREPSRRHDERVGAERQTLSAG